MESVLGDDVGFLLSRAAGTVVRATNAALAPHGLRVRQYSVLQVACASPDGVSQRDLADALGLDPSQVVLLVDELTAAGLVERRPSPSDRRTRLVAATAAGRRTAARASLAAAGAADAVLAGLDDADRTALRGLLARILSGA